MKTVEKWLLSISILLPTFHFLLGDVHMDHSRIPALERVEPFLSLHALYDLIESGILPDNTRITTETKKRLHIHLATAFAICRDPRSIAYDHNRVLLRLALELGSAGFYGEAVESEQLSVQS